jgi:pilus assembly protein CpaB
MNKNVMIVLAGGFVIALLVALIVKSGLSGGEANGAQILVAAKTLPAGHQLSDKDVKWQNWPENAVAAGMVVRKENQKLDEVAKGQLRREIGAGEPIMAALLLSGAKGNMMAAALDPGMRAVAIRVKAESMVGGFIAPGDRVDVIMTYEVKGDELDNPRIKQQIRKYAAETILENVRVLAIDQQSKRDDDKAKVGRTVTLEVDAGGAERLNLASTMAEGGLTLSLRPLGDDTIMSKTRSNLTTDAEISNVFQRINRMSQGGSGSPSNTVRVYNGEQIQNMVVRQPAGADAQGETQP